MSDDLRLTALRFAANDLPSAAADAFAARLATDPEAQDALETAVRWSAAVLGQSIPVPDPTTRPLALDRVRRPWLSRIVPLRAYRGHPLAWAGLGGTVVAATLSLGLWLGEAPLRELPAPPVAEADDEPTPHASRVLVVAPNGGTTQPGIVRDMDEKSGTMVVELLPPDPQPETVENPNAETLTEDRRPLATEPGPK